MTDNMARNTLNALFIALDYNGYTRHIYELCRRLTEFAPLDEYDTFKFSMVEDFMSLDVDAPDRILWSTLVCAYGDYGTSPRFGWIEEHEAVEELLFGYLRESSQCYNCENREQCDKICDEWLLKGEHQ